MKLFTKLTAAAVMGIGIFGISPVFAGNIEIENIEAKGDVALKLYVLNCGDLEIRDASVMNPNVAKGTVQAVANSCYLIGHPDGYLLWDAGIPDAVADAADGVEAFGGLFLMKVSKTLESQLGDLNIAADDIKFLSFSHMHSDHTGNANLIKQATWLVQENEFDMAFGEKAAEAGFVPTDYAHLKDNAQKLNGNYDVFGDASVVIVSTPGHTIGHQVLYVDLPKTKPVILSGDLYTSVAAYEEGSMPAWNFSPELTEASFDLVDELIEKTGAQLWVGHDKGQFDGLKKAPFAYE